MQREGKVLGIHTHMLPIYYNHSHSFHSSLRLPEHNANLKSDIAHSRATRKCPHTWRKRRWTSSVRWVTSASRSSYSRASWCSLRVVAPKSAHQHRLPVRTSSPNAYQPQSSRIDHSKQRQRDENYLTFLLYSFESLLSFLVSLNFSNVSFRRTACLLLARASFTYAVVSMCVWCLVRCSRWWISVGLFFWTCHTIAHVTLISRSKLSSQDTRISRS